MNLGSEFSFIHFCIVLTKDDNKKNSTLTVMPLSSKIGKDNIPLAGEVFEIMLHRMKEQINTISNDLEVSKGKLEKFISNTSPTSDEAIEIEEDIQIINKTPELLKKFNESVTIYEKYMNKTFGCIRCIQTISKLRILPLNKYDNVAELRFSKETMDILDKEIIKTLTNYKLGD